MFFLKELEHTIHLQPTFFGPSLRDHLSRRLYSEVEGTCSGRYGYVISVVDVISVGRGCILSGIGSAQYRMKYRAVVFKPFKGEVVDAMVTTVNKMGFFAELGPLQVFVSTHLIPESLKFDHASNPPCYVNASIEQRVGKGDNVRIKIVGTRTDATQIFAIGSMKEDFLGPF